jgi:hypothetical protein
MLQVVIHRIPRTPADTIPDTTAARLCNRAWLSAAAITAVPDRDGTIVPVIVVLRRVDGTTVAIAMETVVEIAAATEETAAIAVVMVASRQAAVRKAVTADSKRAEEVRKAVGHRKPVVRVRNRSRNLNNSRHVRHTWAARTGANRRLRPRNGTTSGCCLS